MRRTIAIGWFACVLGACVSAPAHESTGSPAYEDDGDPAAIEPTGCWATETGCDPACQYGEQRVLEHYAEGCSPTCGPSATFSQLAGTCSADGSGRCFAPNGPLSWERVCPTKLMYPYGDWTCTSPGDWCVEGADFTSGTGCDTFEVVPGARECFFRDVASSKTVNVLLVLYDPVLESGWALHEEHGWNDPRALTNELVSIFRAASGGFVDYRIAAEVGRDHDDPGYGALWWELDLCNEISSGRIDEVWIYASPAMGFQGGGDGLDEFAYKIPGDYLPYDVPANYWMYEGRKKDIPDCNGKTVFVMGWNFERGIAEALESYAHRVESTLGVTISRGDWQNDCGAARGWVSDFDRFTCLAKDLPGSPLGVAGCGNAHSAFNGDGGYDRDTIEYAETACEAYARHEFESAATSVANCDGWGCSGDGYLRWWFSHLPRQEGISPSGDVQNWWEYIVDFDGAVERATNGWWW